MSRYDKRERLRLRVFVATCAVGTIAMIGASWATFVTRPAAYDALRSRGVLATAVLHCHGDNCTLTYVYAGRTHENRYGNDRDQFRGIRVPVLVDPQHPGTMYTVHDVQRNTNAGLGGFGVFCLLAAAALAGGTFWFGRGLRRFVPIGERRDEPPADAPASARAAWLAIDAVEDLLYDGTAPAWGETYRFDPGELGRALDHLHERLAAMPGLEPEWRDIPTDLVNRVRTAKRTPLGGGVRLDPWPLCLELSRIRRRIAVRALRSSVPAADPR